MTRVAAVLVALVLASSCSAEPGHFVPEVTEQPPPELTPVP